MTKEHLETGPSSIRDDSICEPSLNPNKSSGDIGERTWTPEQFLEYLEAFVGEFECNQIKTMMSERGLAIVSAAEIERLRRIEAAHQQQIIDAGEIMKHWQSRALTAESALAGAWEEAAKIAERDTRSELAKKYGHEPVWFIHGKAIASAIRAAVSKNTAESGHSPSTMERD